MTGLLIQGGRVISPDDGLDGELDVLVEEGVIRRIAEKIPEAGHEVLHAGGQIVAPGLVDLHAHLREPGGEISETLETGLAAAVAGGFTSVCAMPNTRPVNDSPELTRRLIARAKEIGMARIFPIAAVSMGSEGERLTDFGALAEAGAVAFSDDGRPVKTAALMRQALEQARVLDAPIIDHCEDPSLSASGALNEGPVAEQLHLQGIPASSEEVCVARDVMLAQAAGAHCHIAHLSTAGALETVRAARRRGARVSCEVTPHHFTLTDEAVLQCGADAKMNPPLRSAHDVAALVAGIADGSVDAIATDHAPHAPELKQKPLAAAPFGVIGFETALALALTRLVHPGKISLWHLISLMSSNPARIIRRPLGRLAIGGAADMTIFDPSIEWTYRAAQGRSKSRNSPFDGWNFKGAVVATVVGGKIVYRKP